MSHLCYGTWVYPMTAVIITHSLVNFVNTDCYFGLVQMQGE